MMRLLKPAEDEYCHHRGNEASCRWGSMLYICTIHTHTIRVMHIIVVRNNWRLQSLASLLEFTLCPLAYTTHAGVMYMQCYKLEHIPRSAKFETLKGPSMMCLILHTVPAARACIHIHIYARVRRIYVYAYTRSECKTSIREFSCSLAKQ